MNKYIWLSLDPVEAKIDIYPKQIGLKIEEKYKESIYNNCDTLCILGNDFFNATIHLPIYTKFYQTTPAIFKNRNCIKVQGYRNVMRYYISDENKDLTIYAKQINREWIISDETDFIKIVNKKISSDDIIYSEIKYKLQPLYWKPEDLFLNDNFKKVVLWEWCKSINASYSSDNIWCPYLFEVNKFIETNFQNKKNPVIKINNNEERIIKFDYNTGYGYQKSFDNKKVRNIRRRIINIIELKKIFDEMTRLPFELKFLDNIIDSNDIPHEFICCISQEIMTDPVKTSDNHIYDRSSIEKWFLTSSLSPLTGLFLDSTFLQPQIELKNKINQFIKEKFLNYNN